MQLGGGGKRSYFGLTQPVRCRVVVGGKKYGKWALIVAYFLSSMSFSYHSRAAIYITQKAKKLIPRGQRSMGDPDPLPHSLAANPSRVRLVYSSHLRLIC